MPGNQPLIKLRMTSLVALVGSLSACEAFRDTSSCQPLTDKKAIQRAEEQVRALNKAHRASLPRVVPEKVPGLVYGEPPKAVYRTELFVCGPYYVANQYPVGDVVLMDAAGRRGGVLQYHIAKRGGAVTGPYY